MLYPFPFCLSLSLGGSVVGAGHSSKADRQPIPAVDGDHRHGQVGQFLSSMYFLGKLTAWLEPQLPNELITVSSCSPIEGATFSGNALRQRLSCNRLASSD
jgi:hypothetical protein